MSNDKRAMFYGFDKLGFNGYPGEGIDGVAIDFVLYDTSIQLDETDILVIPSGIFERLDEKTDLFGDSYVDVYINHDLLLEKERQVINLLNNNGTVVLLVDAIYDSVPAIGNKTRQIRDTDLCKRILNHFSIVRNAIRGNPSRPIYDAFKGYVSQFGVAKTVFREPTNGYDYKILTKNGDQVTGIAVNNQLFVLPFHTANYDSQTLERIAKSLLQAVIDFKQKMSDEVPLWLADFQFVSEAALRDKQESLLGQLKGIEKEQFKYVAHKSMLVTSGDILVSRVISVLENVFNFKVDPIDELKEDAKILDEDGNAICLVEIKGTKKGIRREYINQVDSHRERGGFLSTTPGVLIINNNMAVVGIDERFDTTVPEEHIVHAVKFNVLIVRTIDLLYFIKKLEEVPNKGEIFLDIISKGGGWLRCSDTEYEIVKS